MLPAKNRLILFTAWLLAASSANAGRLRDNLKPSAQMASLIPGSEPSALEHGTTGVRLTFESR